jgi:hypothetical protein
MTSPRRRLRGQSQPTSPDHPILTSHQRFIRSLACLVCGKPAPSECAYVGMLAGLGITIADRYFLPLCGPVTVWHDCCHSRKHYLGAARFWSEFGIEPLSLAAELWRVSGDVMAGLHAVRRARQGMAPSPQRRTRSSPRSALDRGVAFRDRPRATVILSEPMTSERPWSEGRS